MFEESSRFKRQIIFAFLLILLFIGIKKYLTNRPIDPAEYVLNRSVLDNELIREFTTHSPKKVHLYAGGLRHILQRHSMDYFVDSLKGDLFPKKTNGEQIIQGIATLILIGDTIFSKNRNLVLEDSLVINQEKAKYRLVISPNRTVITFFKRGNYLQQFFQPDES